MLIEIQEFVDLIVNNSDNFSFWFPLQMLRIENIVSESILPVS